MIEYELLPFFLSLIIMTVIILWIGILMRRHAIIMSIVIPLALLSTFVSYTTIEKILGYPITKTLADESLYISHIESADGQYLYVWLIEPGDKKPRAIVFPNTEKNRKQAEQAKQGSKNGKPQKLKRPLNNKQRRPGEFVVYNFNPLQHVTKDSDKEQQEMQ